MNKKSVWITISIIVCLALAIIGFSGEKKGTESVESVESVSESIGVKSPSLAFNNVTLEDSTVVNNQTNICTASKLGMQISIYPCNVQTLDGKNIEQDVNFTWTGASPRNITWIFVYDSQIMSGDILVQQNKSYSYDNITYNEQWISNYLVDKIINFTNIGTPDDRCAIGTKNNTKMYLVNRIGDPVPYYYCFTSITTVNSTAFRISGSYNNSVTNQATGYRMEFNSFKNQLQFLGSGLLKGNDTRSYYKVRDVQFNPQQTYLTKWIFTPELAKSGKWHILGYSSDTTLTDSIASGQYIYVDPWWSSSWTKKQQITNLTGNIVSLQVAYDSDMKSDFSDVRFSDSTETLSLPYALINRNATTAIYKVQTNGSSSIYMYYANAAATYAGDITGVYNSNLVGAWFFENNTGDTFAPATQNISMTNVYNTVSDPQNNVSYYNFYTNGTGRGVVTMADPTEYSWIVFARRTSDGSIVAWKDAGSSTLKFLRWESTGGNIVHQVGTGSGYSISTLTSIADSTKWHYYYAGAKASAGNMVCQDGTFRCQNQTIAVVGNSADELDIGGLFSGSYQNEMQGEIDDLVLFNRVLTGTEINYFANQTRPYAVFGSETTLSPAITNATLIQFVSQTPPDISTTNLQTNNLYIVYNISTNASNAFINLTTVKLFWLTNGTNRPNYSHLVNGTITAIGFTNDGVTFTNTSTIFNFTLSDDSVYPTNSLYDVETFKNTPHLNFSDTADNTAIKTIVMNMTNNTQYNILQVSLKNLSAASLSMRVYYCNATYNSGSYATNSNCALVADIFANQTGQENENQSSYWLAPLSINTTTATLGGVSITNPSYFVFRGRNINGWNVQYIPNIVNATATRTTSNGGTTWSSLNGAIDYHLHQMGVTSIFNYYVCANDTAIPVDANCSSVRVDSLNQSDLPPSSPNVFSPVNISYNGIISINYTASISPNGYAIKSYNISLLNADDTFNQTINPNNGVNLSYLWNSSAISVGDFNIHVIATDVNNLTSFGESEIFHIDNNVLPVFSNEQNANGTTYVNFGNYSFNVSILYANGTGILEINAVNYTMTNYTQNNYTVTVQNLPAGTFTYRFYAFGQVAGNLGKTNDEVFTINKAGSTNIFSVTPSSSVGSPLIYGTPINVSCSNPNNPNFVMSFNMENITAKNGQTFIYSAKDVFNPYIADCNSTATQNYTASYTSANVYIVPFTTSLNLSINPSILVGNGTVLVKGLGCPSQITCTLSFNSSVVSNPFTVNVTNGNYTATYITAGNENYTAVTLTKYLNVTSMPPVPQNVTMNLYTLQYPFVDINKSYELSVLIWRNGTLVGGTSVFLNITDPDGNETLISIPFNSTSTTFDDTLLFTGLGDYPFTIYQTNPMYITENITGTFKVRKPYFVTINIFKDVNSTSYINNFAVVTAEIQNRSYDSTLETFVTPISTYPANTPVFHATYSNGQAVIKLWENTTTAFRLRDGIINFASSYSKPVVARSYGTNVYLGQVNMSGQNETIDFLITKKDLTPYTWLANIAFVILVLAVIGLSVMMLFWMPEHPYFGMAFGLSFTIMLIIARVVVFLGWRI